MDSTNYRPTTAQSPESGAPRGFFFISPSRLSCVCAGGAGRVLWWGRFAPGRPFPALSRARRSAACCTRAGRGRSFSGRRRRNGTRRLCTSSACTPRAARGAARVFFITALGTGQPHGDDFLVLHNIYLQCKSAPLVIASASRAGFIPSSGISPPDLLLRFLQFACGSQIIRTLRTYRTPVFNSPAVKPRCRSSRARGGLRAGTGCWSVRGCTRGGSR